MDLFTGRGNVAVVVDVPTGDVDVYDGSDQFHDRYGGKCYYRSRSGISVAGYAAPAAGAAAVATYRVDVGKLQLPTYDELTPVFGHLVVLPVSYDGRQVDHRYPALWHKGDTGRPALIGVGEVAPLLRGETIDTTPETHAWTVRQPKSAFWGHGAADEEVSVTLETSVGAGRCSRRRRVAEVLARPQLALRAEDVGTPAHWLGMRRGRQVAYKVRRGRAVASIADVELVGFLGEEDLQLMLPAGCTAVMPTLVIVARPGEAFAEVHTPDRGSPAVVEASRALALLRQHHDGGPEVSWPAAAELAQEHGLQVPHPLEWTPEQGAADAAPEQVAAAAVWAAARSRELDEA